MAFLLLAGFFVMFWSICCFIVVLVEPPSVVITLVGKRKLFVFLSLVCGLCIVCLCLFVLPLDAIASRKHAYIILTPLKPILYSKIGVYRGIHYFSYFCSKHRFGYSLEPPRRGGSNEYPQSMFWADIWKNIRDFYLKIFSFWRWNFLYIWIGVFS